jgi:hypothetical protein
MTCDLARRALNELVDGERPPQWAGVLAHCVRCAGCRAVQAALVRQRQALRSLPAVAAPVELRGRILSRLPGSAGDAASAGLIDGRQGISRAEAPGRSLTVAVLTRLRSPMARRGRLGLVVKVGVVAVAAGWLLLAGPWNHRTLMAADVRAAVGKVNVWHLSGCKRVGGKQVPWEIWGRRQPFFYREQVGEAVTYDDGKQRVQLIPPVARLKTRGLLLRTASRPGDENTGWSYEAMFQRWAENPRRFAETPESVVFNFNSAGMEGLGTSSDYLYTVSKRTSLPVRYEVRRHDGKGNATVAELLTAEYPWWLPGTAARQNWPASVRRIDTLAAPALPAGTGATASRNGITVQAQPLLMDAEGQVLLRLRGWLGGEQLGKEWELDWNVNGPGATEGGDATWPVKDDRGRLYVEASVDEITYTALPGDHLSIYVPVEPLPAGVPPPRSLKLYLRVAPQVPQLLSGVSNQMEGRALMSETFELAVDLPAQTSPLDPGPFLDPKGKERFRSLEPEPAEAAIARARSWYYTRYYDRRDPSPEVKERIRNSIRWGLRYVALMPATTTRAQLKRHDVARWYIELGEWEKAEWLLKEMLAITERQPHMAGYYRKLAEGELAQMQTLKQKALTRK